MRSSLLPFILLLGCDGEYQTKEGNDNNLIFSTETQVHDKYWLISQDAPIATGTHFEVHIKSWSANKHYNSPEEESDAYKPFMELYEESDIDGIKQKMAQEEFRFETELTILSTASNLSSTKHMGSVLLTSVVPGTYNLNANGIMSDNIDIEVVQPTKWKAVRKLSETLRTFNVVEYLDLDEKDSDTVNPWAELKPLFHPMEKFCLVSGIPFHFEPALFDDQDRMLSGLIPNLDFTTNSESLSIDKHDNAYMMTIDEKSHSSIATLDVKDSFDRSIYTLPLDICVASESDVQSLELTVILEELERASSSDSMEQYEIYAHKLNKYLRRFARKEQRSNINRIVYLIPKIHSEHPIPNLPLELSTKNGLLIEVNAMFDEVAQTDNKPIQTLISAGPTLTTYPNMPVIAIFPNNKEAVITLKSGNIEHSLNIGEYVPEEEDDSKDESK